MKTMKQFPNLLAAAALGAVVLFTGWTANAAADSNHASRTVTRTTQTQTVTETQPIERDRFRDDDERRAIELRNTLNAKMHELSTSIRGLDQSYGYRGVSNAAGTAFSAGGGEIPVRTVRTRPVEMMYLPRTSGTSVTVTPASAVTTAQEGHFSRTTYADGTSIIERR
jgi:hypothetical protein